MASARRSFWLTGLFFIGLGIVVGAGYVHYRSGNIQFSEGRRQYDAGRFDLAAEAFRRATSSNPQSAEAWYWLGLSRRNLGKPDLAAEALAEATRLEPGQVAWWLDYAQALQWSGRYDEAYRAWETAVSLLPPGDIRVRHARVEQARLLAMQGRTDNAIDMLQKMLTTENDPQIRFVLAEILAWAGRFEDSAAQYRQALAMQGDNP